MGYSINDWANCLEYALAGGRSKYLTEHRAKGMFEFQPLDPFSLSEDLAYITDLTEVKEAKAKKKLKFVDAGCGIGSKVALAYLQGFEAYGIELNKEYLQTARLVLNTCWERPIYENRKTPNPDKFILEGDAREHDYSPYDVIYFYCPMTEGELQRDLEKRIFDTARAGAFLIMKLKHTQDYELPKNIRKFARADIYRKD